MKMVTVINLKYGDLESRKRGYQINLEPSRILLRGACVGVGVRVRVEAGAWI